MGERRCETCKFLYKQDQGYSNYTVTETVLNCLKMLNPSLPKDEDYRPEGGDPALAFGATCVSYAAGEPLMIDCEHEAAPYDGPDGRNIASYYTDDAEVIAAFEAYKP